MRRAEPHPSLKIFKLLECNIWVFPWSFILLHKYVTVYVTVYHKLLIYHCFQISCSYLFIYFWTWCSFSKFSLTYSTQSFHEQFISLELCILLKLKKKKMYYQELHDTKKRQTWELTYSPNFATFIVKLSIIENSYRF